MRLALMRLRLHHVDVETSISTKSRPTRSTAMLPLPGNGCYTACPTLIWVHGATNRYRFRCELSTRGDTGLRCRRRV